MAKNNIWKTGGLGALVCIAILVFGKVNRAKKYEENGRKYLSGYYDNTTVKNGKVIPNEQPVFIPSDAWMNYEFSTAFTLSVPNTVELRNKNDLYSQEVKDVKWHGYKINLNNVAFQQKGLAINAPEAFETYCRILVNYEKGDVGDFYKATEYEELGGDEIAYLQGQVKQGCIATGYRMIGEPNVCWVRIGNIYGLEIEYVRTGMDGNQVQVCTYSFFNDNETVTITLSYWVKDREKWEKDFQNVIRTFAWKEIK